MHTAQSERSRQLEKFVTSYLAQSGKLRKPKKILCNNSYERRIVHQLAATHNIPHRSIIDYTRIHIRITPRYRCYDDVDEHTEIYATPQSYVEIGVCTEKVIIGHPDMLPPPIKFWSTSITYNKNRLKDTFIALKKKYFNKEAEKALQIAPFPTYLIILPSDIRKLIELYVKSA